MKRTSKIRQAMWLERINQSLYFRVPWRRRRQIVEELRANLSVANQDIGPDEALKRLGSSKDIIEGYLEMDKGRVDLSTAIAAFLVVPVLLGFLGAFVAVVAADTRDAIAPNGSLHHVYFWLFNVDIDSDGYSVGMSSPFILPVMILAFLIGGRFWRLVPRMRQRFRK